MIDLAAYNRHLLWCSVGLGVLCVIFEICAFSVDYWSWGTFYASSRLGVINYRFDYYFGLSHGIIEYYATGTYDDLDICCDSDIGYCMYYTQDDLSVGNAFTQTSFSDCNDLMSYLYSNYYTLTDAYLLPYGLYVGTIIVLALGGCFSIASVVFGFINACCTPVARCTGAFGLYLWHGCAVLCLVVAMGMGGYMSLNYVPVVGYLSTAEYYTVLPTVWVSSGFGYWLLLVAAIFHCGGVGLVHSYRRYK